jgi:hypothetical protein
VTQTDGSEGAGHHWAVYLLTNSRSATCTLKGAPTISTKDTDTGAAGPALTAEYSTSSTTAPAVPLGPGQQASFYVDQEPGVSPCSGPIDTRPLTLVITLPSDGSQVIAPMVGWGRCAETVGVSGFIPGPDPVNPPSPSATTNSP